MVTWRNPLSEKQLQEWESISFSSRSGVSVKGLFAESRTTVLKGIIVMGHPMGKEAKAYFLKNGYTDVLRNHGYHVLLFDLNGFGESPVGNFDYFEDVIAAGKEAKKRYPDLPIGYHGISMGGQFATIAFAEEQVFDFAIIESAANTLEDFWIHYPIAYYALRCIYFFMPKYRKRIKMIDRIKEAKGLKKLLLIYLENDAVIRNDAGPKFKDAASVPSELVIFKGAKHAQIPKSEHREAYFKLLLDFFDTQTVKK